MITSISDDSQGVYIWGHNIISLYVFWYTLLLILYAGYFECTLFPAAIVNIKKNFHNYSRTFLCRPLKIDKTKVLTTNGSIMKVESIAECSPWTILQYFWPALSNNWSWKPIFGLPFEWPLKTGYTVPLFGSGWGLVYQFYLVPGYLVPRDTLTCGILSPGTLYPGLKCSYLTNQLYVTLGTVYLAREN